MTIMAGIDSTTNKVENVEVTNGAAHFAEQGIIGGSANDTDTTNNLTKGLTPANFQFLANSASAQNIGAGGTTPIYLMGVDITTALAGTLTITGFTDVTGSAVSWVLPATTVGQVLPPGEARICASGCTMTLSTAADYATGADLGNVQVSWRPIN